ncbi:MAG: MerR family transcriptional regulator [Lachnospiraceae bacterium]
MLTIGKFSKISNVTTKALRYYDEIGLIRPAHINVENGYRYYDVAQLETILLINKLKSYFFSPAEIAEVLKQRQEDTVLWKLLKEKRQSIQEKQMELDYVLDRIDSDLNNIERGIDIMSYLEKIEANLVETEARNIAFLRDKFGIDEFDKYFTRFFEKIQAEKFTVLGAPMVIYHDEEFNPACSDMEIAIPVAQATEGTRTLDGGLCVMATHTGAYSELSSVYARLVDWIEKEGYSIVSAPYEIYQTDPDTTAPEDNITEVYFPVKKKEE